VGCLSSRNRDHRSVVVAGIECSDSNSSCYGSDLGGAAGSGCESRNVGGSNCPLLFLRRRHICVAEIETDVVRARDVAEVSGSGRHQGWVVVDDRILPVALTAAIRNVKSPCRDGEAGNGKSGGGGGRWRR
jgi:hypothetical protein